MKENQVIELNDLETVCRICLDKTEKMISIFETTILSNLTKTYKEMLEECASILICADDLLPKKICFKCINYLDQSYNFKIKCLSTEKLLEQIIANSQTNIKVEYTNDVTNDENQYSKDETDGENENSNDERHEDNDLEENVELIDIKDELIKDSNTELHGNGSKNDNTIQKYKCDDCGINFESNAEFYKHQKLVHLKGYKCCFCGNTFKSSELLWEHSPTAAQCEICKKDYGCKNMLQDHEEKEHGKPSQCTQSDTKSGNSSDLQVDSVKHSDEKKFECDICKASFSIKYSLRSHIKRKHTDFGKIFSCDICKKQFKAQRYLRDHLRIHAGARNYICTHCNKGFYRNYQLKLHIQTHSKEKLSVFSTETGQVECSKCKSIFKNEDWLRVHVKRFHTGTVYPCNKCKATFIKISYLKRHERHVHTDGVNPYYCDICKAPFKVKESLRSHIKRKHTDLGSPKYPCTHCNQRFHSPYKRDSHVETHTGEKPFKCSECGKPFSQHYGLNRHMQTFHYKSLE